MTTVPTDPARLPHYKGRPVPWVTKWTGETSTDSFTFGFDAQGVPRVTYPTGPEFRDEHGYLWRREGIVRSGEPQYAQVNATRQRTCMRAPRCQVCGSRLPPGPIRWLMAKTALSVTPEGLVSTISPPTCDGCVPLARRLCPHLRAEGSTLLEVSRFHVYGVLGEAILLDEKFQVTDRVKDVVLAYGHDHEKVDARNMVVRQQVVVLDEWKEMDVQ